MLPAYSFGVLALILSSPALNPLPGVNSSGVAGDNMQALVGLLGQGVCPCDPKQTILTCVQQKSCPAATELAQYGVDKFKEGLSVSQVGEAVIRKYIDDHVRYTFDVSSSPTKGAEKPRITIVEFADFECPHCSAMRAVLGAVSKKYPNDVALVFKQFPLPHHTYSERASKAALAAQRQGKFWEMHDLIFDNQTRLSNESFSAFAKQLGLDLKRFNADMVGVAVKDQLDRDKKEAIAAQIQGTPALYINGRMYTDEMTPEKIAAMVEKLLKDIK
ncbi:MAG: thioredoxin domain-containing protein [Myxococcota bacterium]|nr:thioredoxin domain-containing protein [Myxococcota bacterium]